MRIQKRLVLSNMAMILIPMGLIITTNVVLGFMFNIGHDRMVRRDIAASYFWPSVVYMLGVCLILILTNGSLAALVSRSITRPLALLEARALRIRDGDLSPDGPSRGHHGGGRDEFDPVFEAFDEMRERLRVSLERQLEDEANRRELIASISHDLRTPLAVIKGYAEGLRDGIASDPAQSAAYIQTILSKAAQLDRLIEDLFLFSSLELDGFAWDLHPVALGRFIEDCMEELAADHPALGVSVACGANPLVRLDAQKLRRVFANVVQNAASYAATATASEAGQRARFDVSLRTDYGKAIVVLRDYGPGLLPGTEDRVFERFYRADASRTGGGAGLGLAIARRIVAGHGGSIRAENAEGGGAAFTIELPVAAALPGVA
jgi:signal transduction histidine kinase